MSTSSPLTACCCAIEEPSNSLFVIFLKWLFFCASYFWMSSDLHSSPHCSVLSNVVALRGCAGLWWMHDSVCLSFQYVTPSLVIMDPWWDYRHLNAVAVVFMFSICGWSCFYFSCLLWSVYFASSSVAANTLVNLIILNGLLNFNPHSVYICNTL